MNNEPSGISRLKCFIGLHQWHRCKCSQCGKMRDVAHDWLTDPNQCAECGKRRSDLVSEFNRELKFISDQVSPFHPDSTHTARYRVLALLRANPDLVQSKDHSGSTPLNRVGEIYWKAREIHPSKFCYNPRSTTEERKWALRVLAFLLNEGADVSDALDNLIESYEAIKFILKLGIKMPDRTKYGFTLLGEVHNADVLQLLLANGADVNAKDKFGHTPLYKAAWLGPVYKVKLLLQNKADPNAIDSFGKTPLAHLYSYSEGLSRRGQAAFANDDIQLR